MNDAAVSVLSAWSAYFAMMGTAAASLTGLMFVVITLVTGAERGTSRDGISTFSTPTVLHFGAALVIAAILSAPWHVLVYPSVLTGAVGVWGVAYVAQVTVRSQRLSSYKPDAEDLAWYTILPFVAYLAILAGAVALTPIASKALFALGAGALLLIFIGIHNAWDVVTFLATGGPNQQRADTDKDKVS